MFSVCSPSCKLTPKKQPSLSSNPYSGGGGGGGGGGTSSFQCDIHVYIYIAMRSG